MKNRGSNSFDNFLSFGLPGLIVLSQLAYVQWFYLTMTESFDRRGLAVWASCSRLQVSLLAHEGSACCIVAA